MQTTPAETTSFKNFNDFLGGLKNKITGGYDTLNQSNEYFKDPQNAEPFNRTKYDIIFDNLDKTERTINDYVLKMKEINKNVEDVINEIENLNSLIVEVRKSVNNHELRSGMQGQTKQTVLQQLTPEERSRLPVYVVDVLNRDYASTPYNPKGKGGKKNKKRNTRRKTLKVHKHNFRRN